jgi:hypothetical protein
LGLLHAPSNRSGELPAFERGRFRRGGGGWFCATVQHGPKFGNLAVYGSLLKFVAVDGGGDDFVREFWCGTSAFRTIHLTAIPFVYSVAAVELAYSFGAFNRGLPKCSSF